MLVCSVSARARRTVAATVPVETAAAIDAVSRNTSTLLLVDDPASGQDIVDAYSGELLFEAANADAVVDVPQVYSVAVAEGLTANSTQDAIVPTAISTWNPSDKAANITLTVGNLKVGATSTTAGAVRSTQGKATGKLYFENTWTPPTGGAGGDGVGIGTATANLSGTPSLPGNATGGCIVTVGGAITYNAVSAGVNIGAIANGQTHCVAVDLVNSRIWFRINAGIWNNSGTANPATNVGGINIATLFPTNAAFAVTCKNGAVPACTANFGASAFTQAIPSGFTAWG